ncbi:MAG: glycosyltransferase family 2 protein [Thermodesulfobacteriota bacterium]|nr:glycosyltransferase family 2 protein [Thermodesulfobacteriota bacterium]
MDISIIIVNWNTKDLLRNCLNSIYGTVQGIALEISVVDNASHDGSVAMLRGEFPQVNVIENKENRGFGAANNQAFGIMKGRYALLLNTDTVLKEHAVYELFFFMEAHLEAAMACGQLLNADGSKQNSIANFPTLLTLLFNTPLLEYLFPKRYPSKRYDYKGPIEIDSGIGACLMVRKQAIDEVGMFDERYFFFFEETDWALQMKTAGWKIYHVPSAFIYHLQGQSIGRDVRSRIEFYRSRYQFFKKWKSHSYYQLVSFVIFVRTIINWLLTSFGNLITFFTNKKLRNKWVVNSKLILWHLNGCP